MHINELIEEDKDLLIDVGANPYLSTDNVKKYINMDGCINTLLSHHPCVNEMIDEYIDVCPLSIMNNENLSIENIIKYKDKMIWSNIAINNKNINKLIEMFPDEIDKDKANEHNNSYEIPLRNVIRGDCEFLIGVFRWKKFLLEVIKIKTIFSDLEFSIIIEMAFGYDYIDGNAEDTY